MVKLAAALVVLACATASAQQSPGAAVQVLRDGNDAAVAGDWDKVQALVDPLLHGQLPPKDLAEAHRLAGLAAFYHDRRDEADAHFFAYLQVDLDGRLDPALYPPDVVQFFEEVRFKHQRELRARRPKPKRSWMLNLVPPGGQFQNGDRTKGYVLAGLLGAFAVGNVTSFLVLDSWCTKVAGSGGPSATCDDNRDHAHSAAQLRTVNLVTGAGLILTYAYGVWDGVRGYRRRSREAMQPFVATSPQGGNVFGVAGTF